MVEQNKKIDIDDDSIIKLKRNETERLKSLLKYQIKTYLEKIVEKSELIPKSFDVTKEYKFMKLQVIPIQEDKTFDIVFTYGQIPFYLSFNPQTKKIKYCNGFIVDIDDENSKFFGDIADEIEWHD
jgi:hypothetical protein